LEKAEVGDLDELNELGSETWGDAAVVVAAARCAQL